MIDVKKLITGFLILAVAAVASGLILSFAGNFTAATKTPNNPIVAGIGTGTNSGIVANAFVDTGTIQGNAAEVLTITDTSSTKAVATDPTNLTSAFADSVVNGLVAANPDGFATDASGTPLFNAPDTASVASEISSNPTVNDFKITKWNIAANDHLIKVIQSASAADIAQYSNSMDSIFNKYFVSTELDTSLQSSNIDPATLTYTGTQVQGALNDALALQVPSSLVPLQKSFIHVLMFEENAAQMNQLAATDPVKASLTLQSEQDQFTAALSDLQKQVQIASTVGFMGSKEEPSASVPFIAELLGVQPAHAQLATHDPLTFAAVMSIYGKEIWKYAQDTILQILKNTLVSLIQQKVLTAIQGNGVPQFVTDYGTELINSFQTAALNKLDSDIQCVPVAEQHLLTIMLSAPLVNQGNLADNGCSAEFQSQLGNTLANNQLFNQFTNFNDFFQVLGGGNIWANAIKIQDDALEAGANSQNAKQTQEIAQQGWHGSQTCLDGSNPNGKRPTCGNGASLVYGPSAIVGDPPTGCSNGSPILTVPNNGTCANGSSSQITTPGQVTGQSFFTVLKSGVENITSARNIAGLLNSLVTSLLNTLSQNAINFANQRANGALTDSGLSGINPANIAATPSSTTPLATQCLPTIQSATLSTSPSQAVATVYANGGAIDAACAAGGFCPTTENPDGTPIYNWNVPGSSQAKTGKSISGDTIQLTYTAPGVYFATVTASTDNTTSSCEIDVQ